MKLCDNCKREPEEFNVGGSDEKGYFFVVPEEELDPAYLMSDLETAWLVSTERNPVGEKGKQLWCVQCVEALSQESL